MIYAGTRRRLERLPGPVRTALDWVLTIGVAVAIVLGIKAWVVNPYRIPSASMEPTLHCARPGAGCEAHYSDRVLANRFVFHLRSPHRGEIVVFEAPRHACGGGGTFVKRLIGLPGDRLIERAGYWYVNGKRLDDTAYVQAGRRDGQTHVYKRLRGYFFAGDNRGSSCDSRVWGTVPRSALIGPVFATYWPLNRISVNTPGPVGAATLAVLAAALVLLAVLGRARRRRSRPAS
jgi:signal peptidase I